MCKNLNTSASYTFYLSRFLRLVNLGGRVLSRFRDFFRSIPAHLFGTEISDDEFQKSLVPELARREDFLSHFAAQGSRSFFVSAKHKAEMLAALHHTCPDAEAAIVKAADRICGHYFDLLGSGPVSLGARIDWHKDFKSGFRWNPGQYYSGIRAASYPGGYDLKIPWELSRCQHFVWLGQAYWLTGDEKYAQEFRAEVEDWIRQNPPEFGVNWACSMDIAIRAVNWLWGYAFFQDSPVLDDDFRIAFCKSLLCHGRHILANLETGSGFTGNHYLSDIAGLIYLGFLLPEFKEAGAWREFGLGEMEREMFKQVHADGGNFEASTNYHRLVTELFLSCTLLARLNGHNFSPEFMVRLGGMLEFIYQITKPDGTVPAIGDQDNGRLHRLKVWEDAGLEWKDFRPLLAVGCVLFNRLDWGKMASGNWEEAVWFYGTDAVIARERSDQSPSVQMSSIGFDNSGLYIMRAGDIYVSVDLGPLGQNGIGGHAHNDTLSFELFASSRTWIQDPGTYVYTPDYEARNIFRSTASHNTLAYPGYEQNGFNSRFLFAMRNESASRLLSWRAESDTYLAGEFRRIRKPEVVHHRSFFLDRGERMLMITDRVEGSKAAFQSVFHLSPGLDVGMIETPHSGIRLLDPSGQYVQVLSLSSEATRIHLSDGWISEGYGVRKAGDVASFDQPAEGIHKIAIALPGGMDNISTRLENALQHEMAFIRKYQLIQPGDSL